MNRSIWQSGNVKCPLCKVVKLSARCFHYIRFAKNETRRYEKGVTKLHCFKFAADQMYISKFGMECHHKRLLSVRYHLKREASAYGWPPVWRNWIQTPKQEVSWTGTIPLTKLVSVICLKLNLLLFFCSWLWSCQFKRCCCCCCWCCCCCRRARWCS